MKKKKLISLFAAVALIGVIGVGATLAYFTDTEAVTNVVTMGHVDITLTEPSFDKDDGTPDNTISNVMPNTVISKDPTVTVAPGSENAYVRVKLDITATDVEGVDDEKALVLSLLDLDIENWFFSDGYYYYQGVMEEGDTATLFTKVTIPEDWGNEYAKFGFNIAVSAEAIQADNFEPQVNADGKYYAWQYLDGNTITPANYDETKVVAEVVE